METRLAINNVTKIFGTQYALEDVSFEVRSGEIVGLLGPNGAGKSTLFKIITGYLQPTSGSVNVCGFDVLENPIPCRKHIGYLPEHNPLYDDLYIKEYLVYASELYGLKYSYAQKRVNQMIQLCGLEPERKKKIQNLSKGYRQRVGLAQALLHEPDVLILDEPTSGLDPNQLFEIRELIRDTGKNTTIVFSTHILQEASALCDRIIIIHKGKIKENSTLTELRKRFIHGTTMEDIFRNLTAE
ncbi:MAG: multidrug ABC transporter ATP-binding protein [Bacteroidetes bacterium RIFCSPLOWO2_12_FULL_37_12]|nr:MAG: multidrug ABC transporter ATP-binding protein [Bacteroidetes bacterium RIFCSPLOWO2_12_FULL_37_12]